MSMPFATVGCGKPDASGIYVAAVDHKVTLIQLVQTSDGRLAGRVQETIVNPDGTVNEKSANADGSISGHDVLLRPESLWLGGVQASGTISGSELTLSGENFTLIAERSSFKKYQDAVIRLRSNAAAERQRIADARATQAAQEAKAKGMLNLMKQKAAIVEASNKLGLYAMKLNTSIDRSPNFGQQAATNTARIAKMSQTASTLASVDRRQLSVAADQIAIDTDQIEMARSQYASSLNQIVEDASIIAAQVQKACVSPQATQLTMECKKAKSAIADFKATFQRGQRTFTPYKNQVQKELNQQALLIHGING